MNRYWPDCKCDDKLATFDRNLFECLKCPEDSESGGIYPMCDCSSVGAFDTISNQCFKCGNDSTGKTEYNDFYTISTR